MLPPSAPQRRWLSFACAAIVLSPLIQPDAHAQVQINELVASSSEWRLKWDSAGQPSVGAGTPWWSGEFVEPPGWQSGASPFGWGDTDIETNLLTSMSGATPSLYLRKTFSVSSSEANSSRNLVLELDYDDGFIAWVNGVEVARCNAGAPGMQIYHEQVAFNTGGGTAEDVIFGPANTLLTPGDNTIAIQVINAELSSALRFDARMFISQTSTLLSYGDDWNYFPGHIEPSGGLFEPAFLSGGLLATVEWGTAAFDDSSWSSSAGPIGFDSVDDYDLGINLIDEMRDIYTSVYMRQEFSMSASQIDSLPGLELEVDYDDGFIAYLNGVEIARGNLGSVGDFYAYDATTNGPHSASQDNGGNDPGRILTFAVDPSLLVAGINVLSAQSHNTDIDNSDLLLDMELSSTGGGSPLAPSDGTFRYQLGDAEPSPPPPADDGPEAEFADWFELHNPGASAVNIDGWSISDDPALPTKFVFPAGTTIDADDYLVVIADNNEELNGSTTYLHASFKLAGGGEQLLLFDDAGILVSQIDFPVQRAFQSYGRQPGGGTTLGYLDEPTPGYANTGAFHADRVDAPDFSIPGGFHGSAVTVTLTSETPGATIRYTTDGTDPTASSGNAYTGPLNLGPIDDKTGHCIRARAFKTGCLHSKVKTHTYLIAQSSLLTGVPALILSGDEEQVFYKPNGVLSIEGGEYVDEQWQATSKDDYNVPMIRGRSYEREAFIEYFEPDGDGFREPVGVRIAASNSARPKLILDQNSASPFISESEHKPSFNIWFRGDYGTDEIDFPWAGEDYPVQRFDRLRVRAGKNDLRNPFIVDELVRRLYRDMGQVGSIGVINTLYINGEFKGYYNLCERLREPFMQDHYNSDAEWDIRQVNEFAEGDSDAWDIMFDRIDEDLDIEANWDAALEYIDAEAIADYYLINAYAAMWDWPHNNWVAARERTPEGRFRFYVWDAEGSFLARNYYNPITHDTFGDDLLTRSDSNSRVFQRLHASAEFRLLFADRIHRHLFNGGTLDDRDLAASKIRQRKDELVAQFEPLLDFVHNEDVNESWYDAWVNPSSGRRSYLFGPSDQQFRDADLWPDTEPPSFGQHGGEVAAGYSLPMSKSDPGTIYYTLDGSDPRAFGGAIAPGAIAYSSAVPLTDLAVIAKARVRNSNGEWSALTEAEFKIGTVAATSANLAVVEIMYHPAPPNAAEIAAGYTDKDEFEFVRLRNIGSQSIDLTTVRFSDGVTFEFATGAVSTLAPGGDVLVVENIDAFRARYGSGLDAIIAGQYGGKFSNGGEDVLLDDTAGVPLQSFAYSDSAPWPDLPDGSGLSLQIIDPSADHSDPTNWRASLQFGGSPGGSVVPQDFASWQARHFSAAELADPAISGPYADPDGDGLANFFEFAVGTLPLRVVAHLPLPEVTLIEVSGDAYLALEYTTWAGATGVTYTVEVGDDLDSWSSGSGETAIVSGPVDNGEGTTTWLVRDLTVTTENAGPRFIRLTVSES